MRAFFFVFTLLFSFHSQLCAQRKEFLSPGEGVFALGGSYRMSDTYFDSNGDKIKIRTNSLYMATLAGEYRISKRFSAFLAFPFFVRSTVNTIEFRQSGNTIPGKALNSLGDSELGGKIVMRSELPLQINAFIKFGIPLGRKSTIGTDTDLQTGDGEFNQMLGVEVSQQVGKNVDFSGYGAFNNRTEAYSDEIRFGFNGSYRVKKIRVMILIDVVETLFNETAPVSLNGIFSNHLEVVSPGASVTYYATSDFWFYTSAAFPAYGRNVLDSPEIGLGMQYKLRK